MLLNLIYLLSALVATGAWLLTDALWVWPLGFVGCFLLSLLICFLIVLYEVKRSDPTAEYTTDDPFIRGIVKLYAPAVFRLLGCKIHVRGAELMPTEGRFLLVSNHCNDSDPIILLRCLAKYQLAFVSKRENSTMFVIGPMMHKLLCQMINRENDREALKTILKCIEIIKEDKASVAVFPEGGILTEDGKLHHFKAGVFKIAQKANVPVVVCTLKNTKDVVKNLLRWKPSHVIMEVVDVIPSEQVKAMKTVEIAEVCHELMAQNLGPELVSD